MNKKLFPALLMLLVSISAAAPEDELLLADEAFRLTTTIKGETLEASWNIAAGYYLYRDKFKFESLSPAIRAGTLLLPAGKIKEDPYFGPTEIYTGRVTARIPLARTAGATTAAIRITAQGCNEPIGVCYPPITKEITLDLPSKSGGALTSLLSRSNNRTAGNIDLAPAEGEPADPLEAFRVDVYPLDAVTLGVRFSIADCCYLYRDKMRFSLSTPDGAPLLGNAPRLGSVDLPPGLAVTDEFVGRTEIYRNAVDVRLPLTGSTSSNDFALNVSYQGCAEKGVAICYEPITRRFPVNGDGGLLTVGSARLVEQTMERGAAAAPRQSGFSALALAMLGAFGAGLLLTFTPCVLPMIPILSGVLIGAEGTRLTKFRGGLLSYTYVLGTALTYTVAGALAGATGAQLQAYFQNPWALGLFSAVLLLFALSMFGLYELRVPAALQSFLHHHSSRMHHKAKGWMGGEFLGVFLLGVFSALIIGACVTPILASTLAVAIASQDAVLGAGTMFALAHGQGAILVAIGISEGMLLPRSGPWMNTVKYIFGVMLLAVAIYLLTPLPEVPVLLLWAALFIICAVYLGATQALPKDASGWRYLWKGVGTLLLVWGVLALVGGFAGGRDILRPLPYWLPAGVARSAATPLVPVEMSMLFERVASAAELDARLAEARRAGKPVILDYYATWCTDCVRMEKSTFTDPQVRETIARRFVALQADVTESNQDARAIKQRFNVFGPPAMLFFDSEGKERPELRSYGYLSATELATVISAL